MTVSRPSAGAIGLHRLQNVRMMADDHRGSGLQHLVRRLHIFRPRRGRVLHAPVNRNHQQIALRARLLDRLQHTGLVHSRRAARFARIGKEVHVRLIVLVGIAIAVEPARHAQPAHLDAVGLDDDRLPGLAARSRRSPAKSSPSSRRCSRVSAKPAQP